MFLYSYPDIIILFLLNLGLSLLIARYIGARRRIGFGWSLFFCIFFSPLLGLIITLLSGKRNAAQL